MAGIKIAYIGGGSTRAAGTVASWIEQGENFAGSEIVLIDLDKEHLAVIKALAVKMAQARGVDIRFTTTTDQRAGLTDCDAVLSSYRPGGFEARYLDESIPLRHGVIGQETQGPGGFFMALRSIHVLKGILADMKSVCPRARLFNYTNPVNVVAQAVSLHSDVRCVALCEGPIVFPAHVARAAGLDPARLDTVMIGTNHGCWSVRHLYDGKDAMPLFEAAWQRAKDDDEFDVRDKRLLHITVAMQSIPASYFQYYYFRDELVDELRRKNTTRAQDIMARVPDYWAHYRDQAKADNPVLDPELSRGGIHQLELAIDVMDAIFNDRGETWPVNVPNEGAIADFAGDLIVEVPGYIDRHGIRPIAQGSMPPQTAGLAQMLAEYQAAAARAAWDGDRRQAIQALACNPLVMSLAKAEVIYDEMAAAQRDYLPERLLP